MAAWRSVEEAEQWLRGAAEAGDTDAMFNLGGVLYQVGRVEEAEQWSRRAAEAGHAPAMPNLGFLLHQVGRVEEAIPWYRRAAEAGHIGAMVNLGHLLSELGQVEEAERWDRRAAEAGNTLAMNNLGNLLLDDGQVEEAERWFRRAAEAGVPEAINSLRKLADERGEAARLLVVTVGGVQLVATTFSGMDLVEEVARLLGSDRINSTRLGAADLTLWQVEDSPGRARPGQPNPAASRLAAEYGKPPVIGTAIITGPIMNNTIYPLDADEAERIATRLRS